MGGRDERQAEGDTWVDAAPFRALVKYLMNTSSLTSAELARSSGISGRLIERLLNGHGGQPLRRICPISAVRLLACEPVIEAALIRRSVELAG